MKKLVLILQVLVIIQLPFAILIAAGKIVPTNLKTEWKVNPVGIDVLQPGLSWLLTSSERSQKQTGYQILVASEETLLASNTGDVWNSGKIMSDEQINVVYSGPALKSGTRYFWKVKVWDSKNKSSGWSEPSWWEMGLLDPADWHARWIGTPVEKASPLFRKDFTVQKTVRKATAFLYSFGWYEMHLNGTKVGDRVLTPANTDYSKINLYDSYDVTNFIAKGGNTVGLWLSDGYGKNYSKWGWRWMDSKRAVLQINIEFTDGSCDYVVTDESWKFSDSQILSADMYNGEFYDATREKNGWDINGYNDKEWEDVLITSPPPGKLQSNISEPVRVAEIIRPVSVTKVAEGTWVFDIGQNIAGWVRLRVRGAKTGSRISLRHAETINSDGTINTHTNRLAEATDTYICKGGMDEECYEPRFTYHGFRYVEIKGYPGIPDLQSIDACAVHAGVETNGAFSCSDTLINKIHSNFQWTILNNMVSIPTDNPVRDERTPCQMDANVIYEAAIQNFDVQQYYKKWLGDISGSTSNPDWSAGQVLGPWLLYRYYGDKRILETFYPSAKKEVDHCWATAVRSDYWAGSFGDWCPPFTDGTYEKSFSEGEVVNTCLYYYITKLLSQIAGILEKEEDSVSYAAQADSIMKHFKDKFLDKENNKYGSGRQITYVMPLLCGLVPENRKSYVEGNLKDNVLRECSGHFGSGIYGTSFLPDILCDYGMADVAYRLFTQTTYPGFGYQILSHNATTTWEQWDVIKTGKEMETYDHAMFSGADKTFYTRFGGIQPLTPGYKTIQIRPCLPDGLNYVRSSVRTVRGQVTSDWDRSGEVYKHSVTIPVNTTAIIYIPGTDSKKVYENGVKVSGSKSIRFLRNEDGYLVYEIGSGNYNFTYGAPVTPE